MADGAGTCIRLDLSVQRKKVEEQGGAGVNIFVAVKKEKTKLSERIKK